VLFLFLPCRDPVPGARSVINVHQEEVL